jgi:hypothetical protein
MIRKSLFWGLTLILVLALAYLMIRGRRTENQEVGRPAEVVREYKPSATRVLAPQDLEFLLQKMALEKEINPSDSSEESRTARHRIKVRNNGKVPYKKIQFCFDYLDRNGKVLETRTHPVAQTILPGTVLDLTDIRIHLLPMDTADYRAAIDYADIGRAPGSLDSRDSFNP